MHIFHKWRKVKVWKTPGWQQWAWETKPSHITMSIASGCECSVCGKRRMKQDLHWEYADQPVLDSINEWESNNA